MKVLIMIPTYNEKDNIGELISRILGQNLGADTLIIDDDSPDGTGKIVDEMAQKDGHIKVIHRPRKSGRGTASYVGFKYAIEQGYERYIEMDADGSHPPEELPALIAASKDTDIVIGSRFVQNGKAVNWGLKRILLHKAAELAIKIIIGSPAKDNTNGYKCYNVDVLKKIDFGKFTATGYVAHTLLANLIWRAGYKITEVPTIFNNRAIGNSKNSRQEAINGIKDLVSFRASIIKRGYRYYFI